jgi:Sap-like sulfolipid-1-addressing protein
MSASFIGLACLAALNPKLLVVDLLLIGNRRPVPMFVCFMLGGIGLAVAIGLVDVFVLQVDAIKTQGSASAGLDLALGIPLVAVGALLASGRLHRRQRQPHARPADKPPPRIQAWAQRVLHEPRFVLAVIIGAAVGTPGGEYLLALHEVVTGKAATAVQAADVVVFVILEFALVIVPFAFLVARPEGVKAGVERFKVWLIRHALQVVGAVALVAGGYMVISSLLRLS